MRRTADELGPADREFLAAFESCAIPASQFGHREHLRLGYIYLTLRDADTALIAMRSGLQRFLAHAGAPPTKYHETITRAWLLALQHFMSGAGPTKSFDEFAASAPRLFEDGVMETHYTAELLRSETAREQFIEPDLQPIPRPIAAAE